MAAVPTIVEMYPVRRECFYVDTSSFDFDIIRDRVRKDVRRRYPDATWFLDANQVFVDRVCVRFCQHVPEHVQAEVQQALAWVAPDVNRVKIIRLASDDTPMTDKDDGDGSVLA